MGFLHINCIREWLESKKETLISDNIVIFKWENINCEICKTVYDTFVDSYSSDGFKQCILDFKVESRVKNFVAFEYLNAEKSSKTIQVIDFGKHRLHRVGYDETCTFRIFDDSISSYHALITYHLEYSTELKMTVAQVLIQDMYSRYGTFILMNEPVKILDESRLCVQVGPSIFFLSQYQKLSYWFFRTLLKCLVPCIQCFE